MQKVCMLVKEAEETGGATKLGTGPRVEVGISRKERIAKVKVLVSSAVKKDTGNASVPTEAKLEAHAQ